MDYSLIASQGENARVSGDGSSTERDGTAGRAAVCG
jgi:hypothetical protein